MSHHTTRHASAKRMYVEPRLGLWDADFGSFARHPNDPRTDPDAGWRECLDCDADGCDLCDHKGGFLGDQPMAWSTYQQLMED